MAPYRLFVQIAKASLRTLHGLVQALGKPVLERALDARIERVQAVQGERLG